MPIVPYPTPTDPGALCTPREACDYLKITDRTMRRYVSEGKIRAYRIGTKHIRLRVADVEALLERIPTGGAA